MQLVELEGSADAERPMNQGRTSGKGPGGEGHSKSFGKKANQQPQKRPHTVSVIHHSHGTTQFSDEYDDEYG